MAKPMLVTLPFVLLLLDYWPLHRFQGIKADYKFQWSLIRPLLWEKVPLFALVVLSSIVTYIAQQKAGALGSAEVFPLSVRIGNAFVSYVIYIGNTIWPGNLAVFYPHPGLWPLWQFSGAFLLLIGITLMVIWTAKRFPYLTVGWLWYLGTLVPVIGIVQVGSQAMADRYTYIPLTGLFIMAAWGIPELLKKWRYRKEVLIISSALTILCLFIVTWIQVGYWQNSITLFDHTLKVTTGNSLAYNNRGNAYQNLGNYKQAINDYDRAIEINPNYADAYNNRGYTNQNLGNYKQAIGDYDRAIEINPKYAEAYNDRGNVYLKVGNYNQAIKDYGNAIELNPQFAMAYYNRGVAYGELGNYNQSIKDYNKAIELNPKLAQAYSNRGGAYGELGNYNQEITDCDKAIGINPKYAEAYNNRGVAYVNIGSYNQAIEDFNKAIELDPKYANAYNNRGVFYGLLGNYNKAIEEYKIAARLGHKLAQNFLKKEGIDW
jgi:tetratricopeptide (TPR) repeat protein